MQQLFRTMAFLLLQVYSYILLARCVLSWLPGLRGSGIWDFLYGLTEPIVSPVRQGLYKLFPPLKNFPIDFSVLAVFLIIDVLRGLL